jgi:DNA-binding transcriptional regulator LsrR (DeoR family)
MGVSRTTLDRRIDRAREKGLIANDWIFKAAPKQLFEVLAEMEDADLKRHLTEKYGQMNLPELTIVPSWPAEFANIKTGKKGTEVIDDIDETNMRLVAHTAAKVFIKRLPRMEQIGLSYGRTLYRMTDVLEYFSTSVRSALPEDDPNAERAIVTIFGSLSFSFDDERHGEWLENSASHLTNRLAGILGTNMYERRFLESPVYVPPAFLDLFNKKTTGSTEISEISKKVSEAEALQIAKAFVEAIPTYHDVFGRGEKSAINKLDTVITSVGDLDTGFGSVPEDAPAPLLREGEREKLCDEAVGDIAGRYVTKDGTTGEPGSTIAKVNNRIFGLTIEDLEEIAQRAAEEKKPGVIVIASSKKKARVISALLNRQKQKKVISELIISGDLAEALLKENPS